MKISKFRVANDAAINSTLAFGSASARPVSLQICIDMSLMNNLHSRQMVSVKIAVLLPVRIGWLASNGAVYSRFGVSAKHSRLD